MTNLDEYDRLSKALGVNRAEAQHLVFTALYGGMPENKRAELLLQWEAAQANSMEATSGLEPE